MTAAPTLYTTAQAAERLGRSVRAVQSLARTHSIGQRLGRDLLLTEADITQLAVYRPGRPKRAASEPAGAE